MAKMLIGYERISKADGSQSLDLQHDAVSAAGVEQDKIYEDRASGSRDDRPGLTACLKSLRAGDVLVVWKLDRLGRSLAHLVNTVKDLSDRNIGLRVLPISDLCKELGIERVTLYRYVGPKGELRDYGKRVLGLA
ncbi:DNA invertase Pin-like site-specific DNA recombinase [Ochrobactrum sp. RC6B]|nr:DNA invertase Pin-like site-specific DNA recombinase [Ochrobactrum sp. RC6B]